MSYTAAAAAAEAQDDDDGDDNVDVGADTYLLRQLSAF